MSENGAAVGLGKNTSISSPPPSCEEVARAIEGAAGAAAGRVRKVTTARGEAWVPTRDERETRFRMRATNWELSPSPRQQKCGRCRRQSDVLVMTRDDGAHFSGLVVCGSVHCCPVCAAVIQCRRRKQLEDAERNAHERGYGYAHVTITARHTAQTDPKALYEAISAAWSHARSGAPWQRWKARIGFLGTIRATDATVGANGLHVHFHVALVTGRPLTVDELGGLRAFWFARYSAKLRQLGHEAPLEYDPETGDPLAIHVTQVPNLGDYLAKLPLAWELTASQTKASARGSRTMWEVLRDAAAYGRKADAALWRSWCKTMHGKNSLVWSKGLKALLLTDPNEYRNDLEEAEREAAELAATAREVARIPGPVWDLVAHQPELQATVLEAAEVGADAVWTAIEATDLSRVSPARLERFRALQAHQDRQNVGAWLGSAEREARELMMEGREAGGVEAFSAQTNAADFARYIPSRVGSRVALYPVPWQGGRKVEPSQKAVP